jgi:hypothetical protein
MKYRATTAAVLTVALLIGHANACPQQGKTTLWADDFQSFDPSWGPSDNKDSGSSIEIKNGTAVLNIPTSHIAWRPNTAGIYDDINLCLKVKLDTANTPPAGAANAPTISGGALFWYVDKDNFYTFLVDASARAAVLRKQNGHWTLPVHWLPFTALPGSNELGVVIVGDQVSLFINDKQFNQFKGIKPSDGALVGVFGQSTATGVGQIEYSDFKVTNVETPKPQ